jgi:exosortase
MIPLPYVVTKEFAYNLRLFDSAYSVAALKIIDIPVYRDSYFLHLPNITLEVADGCSGVASIFALFAVYAYLSPVPWIAKFLVSASAVPIAILANLVRIIVISKSSLLVSE